LSLMPVVLAISVDLLNPKYEGMLFHDPRGHKIIIAAIIFLAMGVMVMRGMIRRVMR
jgi:Flp pilus assembly protein TadB